MEGGRKPTVFEPVNGEENTSAYDSRMHMTAALKWFEGYSPLGLVLNLDVGQRHILRSFRSFRL